MRFLGLEGPVANGTNRVAILPQNLAAIAGFARKGYFDWKLSLSLAACALPGAALGAILGTRLDGVWFDRTLAVVMIIVMIILHRGGVAANPNQTVAPSRTRRWWAAHAAMVVAGFYGGFIMAGVGYPLIAILHRILGLDLVRVNQHKVFIIALFTFLALVVFASRGQVKWPLGIATACGTTAGGWIGSHLAVAKGEKLIRRVLMVALSAMVIKLLWPF